MLTSHDGSLLVGYTVAMLGWLVVRRLVPRLWPARDPAKFERPWREFGFAVLAAVAVLGVGQLHQRGWLLPTGVDGDSWRPWLRTINQVLLYSPMLLLLWWRKAPLETAWLPVRNAP